MLCFNVEVFAFQLKFNGITTKDEKKTLSFGRVERCVWFGHIKKDETEWNFKQNVLRSDRF